MARQLTALLSFALIATITTNTFARHPERNRASVFQRHEVLGPIGSKLPPSIRRTHNRPTYLGGKIASLIAPSSQEAMTWQKADNLGVYRNESPRIESRYFYPKPWEALRIGPRVSLSPSPEPVELKSLRDVSITQPGIAQPNIAQPIIAQPSIAQPSIMQPGAVADELALPADTSISHRGDVVGSGVDEDAIRSESDLTIGNAVEIKAATKPKN